ncbi:MAG: VWA domain-containing protein, partial [Treponema sp.]|nr:VWA domain-containing protein [Treponema sp.]
MKKIINFTLLSLLVALFSYSQQQTGGARNSDSPIDLIVLIDTSLNMSGHYREFTDYVSGPFLREFLRIGDTFHILSFSDSPKTELARRIEGVGDVETIIGRLYLLYPLESRRDLNGALDYAGSYIAGLPNRPRKLVLFTAGQEAIQFTRTDTDFYPVQFPLTGPLLSSGRPPRPAQAQPPAQTQPRQPATQTPSTAPAQTPTQTPPAVQAQPRQPAAQTPPPAPAQPPAQTQPRQQPPQTAQAQPSPQIPPRQQPAAQTPP